MQYLRRLLQTFAAILTLAASVAGGATFTVTSTADTPDANPADGVCGDASGACTLRAAISQANASANPSGSTDIISFDIPGIGPHVIRPINLLPDITEAVVIDGYTQPNASPNTLPLTNNASIMIEIDGSRAPIFFSAGLLTINATDCVVRGLAIHSYLINIRVERGSNVIEGNFIGLDASGTVAPSNADRREIGLFIDRSGNNRIGGTLPSARNVISSNGFVGIYIFQRGAENNVVQGNFIGTDITGTIAIPNGDNINVEFKGGGILLEIADSNIIGGNTSAARNIISGNLWYGIKVQTSDFNIIQSNWIGVAADGNPLGNELSGISVDDTEPSDNLIGGTGPSEGNVIAHNGNAGVLIGARATRTRILSNSIFQNNDLGIDLTSATGCDGTAGREHCPDGVSPNDPLDSDGGPNDRQNFPVLSGVSRMGGSTRIDGTISSMPSTPYRIELFSSVQCDPLGNGEGNTLLSSADVSTDSEGNASFGITPTVAIPSNRYLTATATDTLLGNTSEFSACLAANSPPVAVCSDTTETAGPSCTANSSIDNGSFDPDGDSITLDQSPPGPYSLGSNLVQLTVTDTFLASGICVAEVTVVDETDPLLSCPSDAVIPATSTAGATYSFSATAVDNCPAVSVDCTPASASVFAIGDTAVNCSARDSSENEDTCTFSVRVQGAEEQLTNLIALVGSLGFDRGRERSLVAKLQDAVNHLGRGNERAACRKLGDFDREVTAQRGKDIPSATADLLLAESARIQAVIGC